MKKLILSTFAVVAIVTGFVLADNALNPAQAKDCSANAVAKCGVWSVAELRSAYNGDTTPGLKNIYSGMGITSEMVNSSTVKEGTVGKDGKVTVGGEVVATNAASAGRTVMSHTTQRVKREHGGTVYYESSTSDSFSSTSLAAFVFFDGDGTFQGAVVKDCGNPVKGEPNKPKPKPEPKPEPEVKYSCDLLEVKQFDANDVSFNVKWSQSEGVTQKSYVVRVFDAQNNEVYNTIDDDFETLTPGEYTIKAFVTFDVKGKEKEVTSDKCTATRTIKKKEEPGIEIEKLVNDADHATVNVDQEFTYKIKVTNTGNIDLKDAVITDTQPTGVIFVKASEGEIKDGMWTVTIDTLKVEESKSFTITAKAPEHKAGTTKNKACVDTPTIPGKPDDCDEATIEVPKKPEPGKEKVCELETKEIIKIDEGTFDSSKHSRDLSKCDKTPETPEQPEVPKELPETGAGDGILNILGLSALATATFAYVASRRSL